MFVKQIECQVAGRPGPGPRTMWLGWAVLNTCDEMFFFKRVVALSIATSGCRFLLVIENHFFLFNVDSIEVSDFDTFDRCAAYINYFLSQFKLWFVAIFDAPYEGLGWLGHVLVPPAPPQMVFSLTRCTSQSDELSKTKTQLLSSSYEILFWSLALSKSPKWWVVSLYNPFYYVYQPN